MNKKLYLTLLTVLPFTAFAQPVVNSVEDYQIGTAVKYVNCNSTGITPGSAGANQHWMFTALTPIDTVVDQIVPTYWTPYASQHPDANMVRKTKDGDYLYYNKTANATYLVGEHDVPAGRHITHKNSILSSKRPMTFNDNVKDTFTSNELTTNSKGGGIVEITVDGYGMLHLPGNKVYNNTIRVKVHMVSLDTIAVAPAPFPSPSYLAVNSTLYAWYDNDHKSALLRMDSIGVFANGTPVQSGKSVAYYLDEYPSDVTTLEPARQPFSANLNGRNIMLAGDFKGNRMYEAGIYNLNGQKIQDFSFRGNGNRQDLLLNADLTNGMYIILLKDETIATPEILKVVKQ